VAEIVAFQIAGAGEAMLEELGDQVLVFRDSNQAVANIARRKHAQFAAKTSAGAAIVAYRDDRSELGDELSFTRAVIGADRVLFKTFEQGGETGPATDGNHTYSAGGAAPDLLCLRLHRISLTFPGFRT